MDSSYLRKLGRDVLKVCGTKNFNFRCHLKMLGRTSLTFRRTLSQTPCLSSERALFRFDHKNEFRPIPQTWVSTLEDVDSPPIGITNLHPG